MRVMPLRFRLLNVCPLPEEAVATSDCIFIMTVPGKFQMRDTQILSALAVFLPMPQGRNPLWKTPLIHHQVPVSIIRCRFMQNALRVFIL